ARLKINYLLILIPQELYIPGFKIVYGLRGFAFGNKESKMIIKFPRRMNKTQLGFANLDAKAMLVFAAISETQHLLVEVNLLRKFMTVEV
ncbi:MAG: hypothetical protein AAF696_34255, partial [Bacteroidota bacterium]